MPQGGKAEEGRPPRLAPVPVDGVALIPKCAECEAVWLPADEERWTAYLGGDDLDEAARDCLLLLGMRGARVR
jgi:hypothetical protein